MIILTEQEKAQVLSKCTNQFHIDWITRCIERPVEQINLQYHLKKDHKNKYGDQIFVYFMASGAGAWIRRKDNTLSLAIRAATRDECIDMHFRTRLYYLKYGDWDKLIEDEIWSMTNSNELNREFIQELRNLSLLYTLKPKH